MFLRALSAATLFVAGTSAVRAQAPAATSAAPQCQREQPTLAESDRLPEFSVRQLPASGVRALRAALRNGCWTRALATYYSIFRPDLPDWVVYIDSSGVIHQTFIHGTGGDSTSRVLHGERYIWLSIFSDKPMRDVLSPEEDRALRADLAGSPAPRAYGPELPIARVCSPANAGASAAVGGSLASGGGGAGAGGGGFGGGAGGGNPSAAASTRAGVLASDTSDMRFSRRLIAYHRDPVVSLLIKGLTKLVGVDPGSDPAAADSTRLVELQEVSSDTTGDRMYAGFGRFGLIENAQVELSLAPVRCKAFPAPPRQADAAPADSLGRLQFIYADFANAKHRMFDLAVLTAVTWGGRIPTYNSNLQIVSETPRLSANAYLTVVYNAFDIGFLDGRLAHDPFWQQRPFGIFAGTNVARGSLADELVAGGAIGNLIGNAGISVGCSWTNSPHVEDGHTVGRLQRRLLVGFDLRL
jgi:hypothetical protein